MKTPLVFSMSPKGDEIARHVAQLLGSPVHCCGQGRTDAAPLVEAAYSARLPIVGVCAAGVLIRLLGPDLGDKTSEPPVLAVSADGKIAVPLLGSHRGANALARWIADMVGGVAAITSFSDTLYDFSLDDPPPGYVVGTPELVRPTMAALLNGERLKVHGPSGWLELAGYPIAPDGRLPLTVTEKASGAGLLVHPRALVAGIGCTSKASGEDIVALIEKCLAMAELSPLALAALATIDTRSTQAGPREAAAHFGVPLRVFTKRELEKESRRLPTPSEAVGAAIGLPGVCEAVALKAGRLIVTKQVGREATCAIGCADAPIEVSRFGKLA